MSSFLQTLVKYVYFDDLIYYLIYEIIHFFRAGIAPYHALIEINDLQ